MTFNYQHLMLLDTSIAQDIQLIQLPYNRTVDVLSAHKYQIRTYYEHRRPGTQCDICCNYATARYVHVNGINILFCDECRHIQTSVVPKVTSIGNASMMMSALWVELPALRNAAIIVFERLRYLGRLIKFNEYDHARPCVLCHCIPSHSYASGHCTVLVCNNCCTLAHNNITIRVRQMYLGMCVIASIQQHDIYASIARLYLALLWGYA